MNSEGQDVFYQEEDDSIDWSKVVDFFKRLWSKRRFILLFTVCFMALGLFVAIFSPVVYKADCLLIPQASSAKKTGGQFSNLAAMVGINLNGVSTDNQNLPPSVYPEILNNIHFQKELLQTPIRFQQWEQPVKLIEYYTNPDYASFNVLAAVKKYTVGLPGLLKKALLPKKKAAAISQSDVANKLQTLTEAEYLCVKNILPNIVSMSLDNTQGVISLSASMPDPVAAAQLTQEVVDLLQKYITEYKIKKAQDNLAYIQSRFEEAKQVYETKQKELASFLDANRTLSTAKSLARQKQLENEYDMANSLYMELAMQQVQAQQIVKEDTPLLTAIKPVVVPMERDRPHRKTILMAYTFIGFLLGCGVVVLFNFLHKNNVNWPKRWAEVTPDTETDSTT